MVQRKILPIRDSANSFLSFWNSLYLDFWWRKKYNIPFGSSQHREMNPIDMLIEYLEEEQIKLAFEEKRDHTPDFVDQEEIDADYENLKI